MAWRAKIVLGMLVVFILGVGLLFTKPFAERSTISSTPQLKWIDFELPTSQGLTWSSTTVDNQVVVLNFWAPWCLPCRTEIPYLIEIQMRDNPSLVIIGIAIDHYDAVRHFENEIGLNYLSLVGETKGIDLMRQYGASSALPLTLVFDRRGKLHHYVLGAIRPREFERVLEEIL